MVKAVKKNQLIFVIFSLFILFGCGGGSDDLPETLGSLSLSRVIQGEEATAVVTKMHCKSLEPSANR